jgi:hypothetical protein
MSRPKTKTTIETFARGFVVFGMTLAMILLLLLFLLSR